MELLNDEQIQAPTPDDHQVVDSENMQFHTLDGTFFIDDDYEDQLELSMDDRSYSEQQYDFGNLFYPSAASFPDMDLGIPKPLPRNRVRSHSEPDLPSQGCHRSLQQRMRRWGSAIRDVWTSSYNLTSEEGRRGQRHPHNLRLFQIL